MSLFDELDQYLMVDYHVDYWSDEAVPYAARLADMLDDEDWQRLVKIWPDRPVGWQVRLADAVFGSGKERVSDLLRQMLQSSNTEVALAAALSLDARDEKLEASLRTSLERLSSNVEVGYLPIIEKLISNIKT